jgi:hypothetical protein
MEKRRKMSNFAPSKKEAEPMEQNSYPDKSIK